MRRYLLFTFLAIFLLLTITVGVGGYLLHQESFLKSRLSSLSLKYTGRELTLKGPLELDLGRVTTLEANEIHFANAPWADQPDMVVIGHLKISVEISSLFGDRPVFPLLSLQDCKVELAKNPEDEANWHLLPEPGQKPGPEPKPARRKNLPVWLKNLAITDCQILYTSNQVEEPLAIGISDYSMQHHGDNRWTGKGTGSVNAEPVSLDGWFEPFDSIFLGGPLEHELNFRIGKVSLSSSGSVKDAATWSGANVTAEFKGPEIANLLEEFRLPSFSDGAFDFKAVLNTEGKMTRLQVDGDLGSLDVRAHGELDRLIRPSTGKIQIEVDGPNIGALAKIFGLDGVVEKAFSHQSNASFEGDVVHLRKTTLKTDSDQLDISGKFHTGPGFPGTELDISFHTDEAGDWTTLFGQPKQALGALSLNGTVSTDADAVILINARAEQGASTLDVDGTLGRLPGSLQPDLKIAFKSPDPSHLAAIAGFTRIPAVPLSVQGRFGMKDRAIQLTRTRIDLNGDTADIDGSINLADHYAGTDLSIQLDIRNAGAMGRLFGEEGLPDQPVKLDAEITPSGEGLAYKVMDGNLGEIQLELTGRIPDLDRPMAMDGDFDISLPRLSDISFLVPDRKLPEAPFSARGKLETRENRVQLNNVNVRLADNQATVNGHLNLENRYAGSDITAQVDIKSIGALGRLFGREGLPDEPVKLTAEVKPNGKGMAFELQDGNLRDIQVEVKGQIDDMDHPMVMDASFDIQLPHLNEISFLFPDRDLPDVAFTAQGQLKNQQTRTHLDQVHLTLGAIKASVDGDLLDDNRFDLSIKADGPDASALDNIAGRSLPPEPFSVSTGLAGNPRELAFSNLDVTLGKSKANGELTLGLGEVPKISGKVSSPYLDLSHWMISEEAEKEHPKPPEKRKWMFDDTPVMAGTYFDLDINADVDVKVINLGNTTVEDFRLGLILSKELIELHPFTMKGTRGGNINGEARIDARNGTPDMLLILHGKDMRLGLTAVSGQDPQTFPPVALDVNLTASGQTRREVASSMNGTIRGFYGSGQVAAAGLGLLFSDFITELFTVLNPFAKTSEYTQLDCAVVGAQAVDGKVSVAPVIYHTEQLTILSQGHIDLKTEKIDLSFNTKPRKGLGLSAGVLINPLIKVGGSLMSPAIELDPASTIKSGGIAVATVGISLLAKSMSDRFLSSSDPCGDARTELEKQDSISD